MTQFDLVLGSHTDTLSTFPSPFGPEDWPEGDAPPGGYFDKATSQSTVSTLPPRAKKAKTSSSPRVGGGGGHPEEDTDMGEPIEDVDLTRIQAGSSPRRVDKGTTKGKKPEAAKARVALAGLEEEFAIIDKHGHELVDEFIEKGTLDSSNHPFDDDECKILSNRVDTFDTDEEGSDDEKEDFNPRKRIPRVRLPFSPQHGAPNAALRCAELPLRVRQPGRESRHSNRSE